ncbi:MAG TPA: sulfatase [Thermoanaerobaculia bacterium]|jgi:arylsulfatase A-like enzyme|nr:sulfatase [Thermoanaerobaculia bacterium]
MTRPPIFLLSIAAALFSGGAALDTLSPGTASAAEAPRPNIVFVLTDDQELTLGSLDFMPRTRALIGAQGTTFASHFVPLSLCCPSRSTILTGKYPHNHRVYTNFPPDGGYERFDELGHEATTMATALHAAGYRTALFGKYLNGYPGIEDPTHVPSGWDEWASPVAGSPYASYHYTLNENGTKVKYGGTAADYMTDVLSGKATDFVRRTAGTGQPFFLYMATYAPHRPSTPARRHANLFPGLQAPRTPSFNESNVTDKPGRIRALRRLKAGQIAAIDALYRKQRQALQGVDEAVAALVQVLQDSGQLANTYVVFTSDNGFHMGQHRLEPGKYTPYETDVHVPLMIRGPGVPVGATVTSLTASVDLAPTFAELAGAVLPLAPDGRSLVPFLHGQTPAGWRQAVLLEQFAFPPAPPTTEDSVIEPPDPQDEKAVTSYPAHQGLRTADFKFVEYGTGEREVYDLRTDPDETNNLRNRVPLAWLNSLSGIVHALGHCAGASCRQLEAQPVPPLPHH